MQRTMESVWDDVEYELGYAHSITWDQCHKIYLQMDEAQTDEMRGYGYDPIILVESVGVQGALGLLRTWYSESCGLKFIQAVRTVSPGENENDGFTSLIPQGFEEELEEDEEW